MSSPLSDAAWIWLPQNEKAVHQYVCFRKTFNLAQAAEGILTISADTDFIVWINNKEAGRGQFSDYPQDKTFSKFSVTNLQKGENVICVLAYYCGEGFHTYRVGEPGLIASLQAGSQNITTDSSWKCIQHPAFQSGPMPKLTPQLGFTTFFDARNDLDWLSQTFDDSAWNDSLEKATGCNGFWKKLSERPVPPLQVKPRLPVTMTAQGTLKRDQELDIFAHTVDADYLRPLPASEIFIDCPFIPYHPVLQADSDQAYTFAELPENADGYFCIIDFGSEQVGLIDIEITAEAGTIVDISHGEHLADGRVRNKIEQRNFTDRYICTGGSNRYTLPFRRIGGRYLQLNIIPSRGQVKLSYAGLRPLILELPPQSTFVSEDRLADHIRALGIHTMAMCMHEHYEDCPWREQSLYAYDSRNQALFGYYVWGNYDFAATSFDLLGKGIREDGLLEMCAPSELHMTIPIFSFVWVSALHEHWLHSGNDKLFRKYEKQIEFMIEKASEFYDSSTGLYGLSDDQKLWNFYEWGPDMSTHGSEPNEFHAPYNLYLYEMIRIFAEMLKMSGKTDQAVVYEEKMRNLSEAINQNFLDTDKGHYKTRLNSSVNCGPHEIVQVLALYNNIAPESIHEKLLAGLYNGEFIAHPVSSLPYLVRTLMEYGAEARKHVSRTLSKTFSPMALTGTTTLWEDLGGETDFNGAGSLCHAWSSLPVYLQNAHILGIRPIEPGFKKFVVSPFPAGLSRASGTIPTPQGFIKIAWTRDEDGLNVNLEVPANLTPVMAPLAEAPFKSVTCNGKPYSF
jgi:hypothetical protein